VRRGNKRARRGTSPQQHQQQQQQRQQQQPPNEALRSARSAAVLGKAISTTSNVAAIKAARKFAGEQSFALTMLMLRVLREICAHLLRSYLSLCSCFEVKPRRRRNEENELNVYVRKAFRLCIFDEDRDRLLNAAVWPDSIQISLWYFKPPADATGRSAAPSAATASAARADDNIISLISTAIDVAAAAAAPSVDDTGNSVDNAVGSDSNVCMSDDTILTADNFSDGI